MSDGDVATPDLSFLLGVWTGVGRGLWAADPPFSYRERAEFARPAGTYLTYAQSTTAADGRRPLHAETGYLRPGTDGTVELVVAQPTGLVEVHTGTVDGHHLSLRSTLVQGAPRALQVTSVARRIWVDGDHLRYQLDLATGDEALAPHLEGELDRIG
jgi:hypothetical protein